MSLFDDKWRFTHDQVIASAIAASLQRANVYSKRALPDDRDKLHAELSLALQRLFPIYRNPVDERVHVGYIEHLATSISEQHRSALIDGQFRIGSAQKALNLYLKYLWCLRRIPMPPHCPFDSRIIARIPGCEKVLWTKLKTVPEYMSLVAGAKRKAGATPLAEWELDEYNKASSGA